MSNTPPIEHPEPPRDAQPAGAQGSAVTEAPPPTPAAESRRQPSWLVQGVVLALVSAVVAYVASGLPRPFEHTQPSGQVAIENVQTNQTLKMFRGQELQPRRGEELGVSLDVTRSGEHVSANGCRLVWTLLDANGPRPVPNRSLVSQPARWISSDPHSCVTATTIWVPLAPGLALVDRLAVRVQLFAGRHLLDTAESSPISLG